MSELKNLPNTEKNKVSVFETKVEDKVFQIEDNEGHVITVKEYLPYEKKRELIQELMENIIFVDEETGVAYESFVSGLVFEYLILKYYTDLDLSGVDVSEGYDKIHDYFCRNRIREKLFTKCGEWHFDHSELLVMKEKYLSIIEQINKEKNSLSFKIKQAFGSILDGGDIVKNMAESREVAEKMTDILGVYNAIKSPNAIVDAPKMNLSRKTINMKNGKNLEKK